MTILVATSGVAWAAVSGISDDESPGLTATIQQAPDRGAVAAGRLEAARLDLAAEHARIADAEAFRKGLQGAVAVSDQPLLVSLTAVVPAERLLGAAAEAGLRLERIYSWTQADVEPAEVSTGDHVVDLLGYRPGDRQSASTATEQLTTYLLHTFETRAANYQREGTEPAPVSLDGKLAELTATGPGLFGFRCECSLADLTAVTALAPELRYRAIEPGAAGRQPIWPEDPLRDAIIASGGTYGR